MKIAILCQNYLPFLGGVETQARAVAHRLKEEGNELRIAACNFKAIKLPTRLKMLADSLLAPSHPATGADEGIPVTAFSPGVRERLLMAPIVVRALPFLQRHFYHQLRLFGYKWYRLAYRQRMSRWLEGADVLHSMAGGYPGWLGEEVARELGIPFCCSPYAHPGQWGCAPEDIDFYNRAGRVFALIETDRDYLAGIGVEPDKLRIGGVFPLLPQKVDPERFREQHQLNGAPMVLYVGRMMPQKGAEALLNSAEHVWKEFPETRFLFMGPGTPDELQIFPSDEPRISHLGKVSEQEKGDGLAACTVFCMPSTSEILPAVYLEAWSYGRPVVGGMADGLPELITGNKAGTNSSQDPVELAGHLLAFLRNADVARETGARGREMVERRFTVQAIARTYLDAYQELLTNK